MVGTVEKIFKYMDSREQTVQKSFSSLKFQAQIFQNEVLKPNFFIILSCGQLNLEPQLTIRNFKKASREFKIVFLLYPINILERKFVPWFDFSSLSGPKALSKKLFRPKISRKAKSNQVRFTYGLLFKT
jgi:hypothetical protein